MDKAVDLQARAARQGVDSNSTVDKHFSFGNVR